MSKKLLLTSIVFTFSFLLFSTSFCHAAVDFEIDRQEVEITVYEDWSLEIWYYITIETTDGPHNGIYLGIPDSNISDFGASVDNEMLNVEQTRYNDGDVLKIYFPETKYAGDVTELKVSFWAFDRLYPDQTNDENVGVYFIPATWQGRSIPFQSVSYTLPEGVKRQDVKFVPNPDSIFEEDRTTVYFELLSSTPESFDTNVLFPRSYLVPEDEKRENPAGGVELDHIQITIEGMRETHNRMVGTDAFDETLDGIRNAIDSNMYILTNTTLTRKNCEEFPQLLDMLHSMGLKNFAVNSIIYSGKAENADYGLTIGELKKILEDIRERSVKHDMDWYTPTRRCELDPVEMGLGLKCCSAARINVTVEPDGTVIPCQSWFEPMGNILNDSWEEIWNSELARSIRKREYMPEECKGCAMYDNCTAGCPLEKGSRCNLL